MTDEFLLQAIQAGAHFFMITVIGLVTTKEGTRSQTVQYTVRMEAYLDHPHVTFDSIVQFGRLLLR